VPLAVAAQKTSGDVSAREVVLHVGLVLVLPSERARRPRHQVEATGLGELLGLDVGVLLDAYAPPPGVTRPAPRSILERGPCTWRGMVGLRR
jgi:hypothetical protein